MLDPNRSKIAKIVFSNLDFLSFGNISSSGTEKLTFNVRSNFIANCHN